MADFSGMVYPIVDTPQGYFPITTDVDLIKGDLIQLLLTNPGERCLSGDTLIPLADSTEVLIKDLVGKEPFWVYSYDKDLNSVVPGKATAHKTLKDAELLEVTLDNNQKIKCTSNHLWLLRDGTYCRADELQIGCSLMPLYRNLNTSGYERVYQPSLGDYRETHLCFVFGKRLSGIREVVHHKDLNKRNNSPDNLQWMTCQAHKDLHKEINNAFVKRIKEDPIFKENWINKIKETKRKYFETHHGHRKGAIISLETREKLSEAKKKYFQTEKGLKEKKHLRELALKQFATGHPGRGKKLTEEAKEKMRGPRPSISGDNNPSKRPDVREKLRLAWVKRRQKKNHKVVTVNKLDHKEDCYDLHVEQYHNFALSAGAFVHNCMNPAFGTPLATLMFDPNDTFLSNKARTMIIDSINRWEPRVVINAINITTGITQANRSFLNPQDDLTNAPNILGIQILFVDPGDIRSVQELVLQVPLQGVNSANNSA